MGNWTPILIGLGVFFVIVLPLSRKGYQFYAGITGVDKSRSEKGH